MINHSAQARKQYVEEVRRSFHNADLDYGEEDTFEGAPSFFKIRFLISICIFVIYILCDRTGSKLYLYTTEQIHTMLESNSLEPEFRQLEKTWKKLQSD